MQKQSVVIDLPDNIYNQYKQRAEQKQRTIEAEIVEVVSKAVPLADELSPELENLVAQLVFLDDKALQRIARSKSSKKDASQLEALHFKRQNEGLTEVEAHELSNLMKKFERWFVLRNEALAILMERGQNVPPKKLES